MPCTTSQATYSAELTNVEGIIFTAYMRAPEPSPAVPAHEAAASCDAIDQESFDDLTDQVAEDQGFLNDLSEHFDLALTQEELTTKKPTRKRDRSDHERQQLAADILSTSNALIRWANDQIDGHRTGHRVPDTVRQNTKL